MFSLCDYSAQWRTERDRQRERGKRKRQTDTKSGNETKKRATERCSSETRTGRRARDSGREGEVIHFSLSRTHYLLIRPQTFFAV